MFTLSYFTTHPHTHLVVDVKDFGEHHIVNPSFISFASLAYVLDLDWSPTLSILQVHGTISFSLNCKDSFTGDLFTYSDTIGWNEQYSFDQKISQEVNVILSSEFDILNYVVEQINISIPYNLEHNSDIIKKSFADAVYLTQEEYEQQLEDQIDPRWAPLDQIKEKK